ncbi:thiazole synthase [Terasakiella sp. A23]|uniref:thiazole synthase n=1 Tax=Terasakiella sp. FCG-A23 TaxID=3080561 RepID=UPI0039877FA7
MGGGDHAETPATDEDFVVAGRRFKSRLITGTGKYDTYKLNAEAVEASECDIITVAVRRVNLTQADEPMLMDYLDPQKYTFMPNTAGCFTAEDALRTLRLAREIGGWDLVKLEILGDKRTLYPRMPETLETLKVLKKEGFDVMVYCSDDPNFCKALEEEGASAVMPIAAPIGSGLGILNPVNLRIIKENANVPVIVDAGIGTASDAAQAMELGCDAVIMNTAIAEAKDPVRMANAMKHAVIAGRDAYLAGRMPKKQYADPSSPLAGLI